MFRLHMDFPLTTPESDSINACNKFITFLDTHKEELIGMGITDINYRLGNDHDRQKSNYMIRNENGHVANKKSRINLLSTESEVE
jgi:hypothetical protein